MARIIGAIAVVMMSNVARPIAIQLKTVYLPPSETFIYRQLAHMQRWQPHVFAELLRGCGQFPLASVSVLPRPPRAARALFAASRVLLRDAGLRPCFNVSAELRAVAQRAAVLHAHFGESGLAALPMRRATGLPLVTAFHGRDVAQPLRGGYGRWLYRRLFHEGAAFTVVSEVMRGQLVALGAPAERTHVIHTGVDLAEIAWAPRTWPADGAVRLLTCGRLVEKKGTHDAISALARLRDDFPGARLTVIGDGPLRPLLEQHAVALGVASRVTFLGAQPLARVLIELAAAHVFVLPCRTAANGDQEGAPVVLIEAQAAGLPVVSTKHAGVPEIVRDGESGVLVAERDLDELTAALGGMLATPERWPTYGAAGRAQIAAKFAIQQTVDQLERLYDTVCA